MYVAVKGGERAIDAAHRLLAEERRGDPAVPELTLRADRAAARARRRSRDDRGLALRPRAGRARHQAGARRSDRGDLPAARVSHDAAAARRDAADRHGGHDGAPAHLRDVQGSAGRPGARADVRLHAPAARLRAGGRRPTRSSPGAFVPDVDVTEHGDEPTSRCPASSTCSTTKGSSSRSCRTTTRAPSPTSRASR